MPTKFLGCPGGRTLIKIEIATDNWNSDTGYELVNDTTGSIVATKQGDVDFPYPNYLFVDKICLNQGEYTITIFDEWGDGLCCASGSGFFKIFLGTEDTPRFESKANDFKMQSYAFEIDSP